MPPLSAGYQALPLQGRACMQLCTHQLVPMCPQAPLCGSSISVFFLVSIVPGTVFFLVSACHFCHCCDKLWELVRFLPTPYYLSFVFTWTTDWAVGPWRRWGKYFHFQCLVCWCLLNIHCWVGVFNHDSERRGRILHFFCYISSVDRQYLSDNQS